jgi:hypothetical protein
MSILTDSEIMKLNNRLNDSRFFVRPEYTSQSSWPVLGYYLRPNYNQPDMASQNSNSYDGRIDEPSIEYEFTFSICEKRIDEFFEIFDRISEDGVENLCYSMGGNNNMTKKVEFTDKVIHSESKVVHKVYNRNYVKIKYNFRGKVSSIFAYIKFLEDTIGFFGNIWGYTEEGDEVCLLKYPIGNIVSPIKEKSMDVLVIDYVYIKLSDEYKINYMVCEILSDEKSSILKYGDSFTIKEDDLTLSRTNQINSLLN